MKSGGEKLCNVHWEFMYTQKHGDLTSTPPLATILDPKRIIDGQPTAAHNKNQVAELEAKIKDRGIKLSMKNEVAADIDSTDLSFKEGMAPCLTASRGASSGAWLAFRRRRMNQAELMRIQGMDPSVIKVSMSQVAMGRALGNAMSQNVLERIFVALLPSVGLAQSTDLKDRYAAA
ncbi:unnamed protein product [Prorocentrum cordatum]|uniref:DNA (cytosine-5-)-methyltransferase n=1 Tax=Prorocentrum cordatum TaxID=2364126 RepID=A0ABN9XSB5_9DINO|nr:unnamed protein product [Polarella glacialis]